MPNLKLPLTWATLSTFAIFVVYGYLYRRVRQPYIFYWTIGWGIHLISLMFTYILTSPASGSLIIIAIQICIIISSLYLLLGAYALADLRPGRIGIYISALAGFLSLALNLLTLPSIYSIITTRLLVGFLFIKIGLTIRKLTIEKLNKRSFNGVIFIAAGLHRMLYIATPYYPNMLEGYYLLGSILQFGICIGTVLLHFELMENEVKSSREAFLESESRYSSLFHESKSIMLIIDEETNKVIEANPAACDFYGYAKEELAQKNARELVCCPGVNRANCLMNNITCIEHPEIKHKLANGETRFVEAHTAPIQVNGRKLLYGILHDVTGKKEAEDRVNYLAFYDNLTSLPNRVHLNKELDRTLQAASVSNKSVAILHVGFDRFKNINDTLGHYIGDISLKEIAKKLRIIVPKECYIARFSGDEFIILMKEIGERAEAEQLAGKVIAEFQKPLMIEGYELYSTASMGITMFPMDGEDSDAMIKNADIALHKAKELGRNNYQFFSRDWKEDVDSNFYLANDLRTALANNELMLYYQPIMNPKENALIGMEALLRWKHPRLGMISPDKFIPIAEETGLIIEIGQWVLNTACRQCRHWHDMGHKHIKVSINISARQFHESDIYRMVDSELIRTGLLPENLEVEITESIAIRNIEKVMEVCRRLKERGISIAMDDFGTGYSSLSYLSKLPLDTIKIDKSFIKDLEKNSSNRAISLAIIKMAHSLGLKITAEGVETNIHYEYLKENECDKLQGYLFSKPIPAKEFEESFFAKMSI